ncbi:MAG TPA: response regulator transcription factor [Chitinophagaceae bacterium]|nr:response regulator transcription factor [Chitinophagaceae bacterium]
MNPYQLPINLLIADDHQLIIDGLTKILETEKAIGEIYSANNGREAVDKVSTHNIDCVIMDINMPVLNGLEATKLIKKEKPEIKIIVVSMFCDAAIVNKMLKAGADAFINKDTGKSELLKAIDKVMQGEKYISPEISTNLFTHLTDRNVNIQENEKHLTIREIEIIRYIADGLTNNEIADKLFLSIGTVDTHRKNMLAKLHLKNSAALVKYAAEHKLL